MPPSAMSEFFFDVSLEDFETRVFEPSMTVPVVVDFWAPWCGPCQTLKPLLEKLAVEYGGRFLLAKVNADENPELAQHFGVRSIPAVKALAGGRLVDEFTGALPEQEIRAFLDRFVPPPQEAPEAPRQLAARLVAEGQPEAALEALVAATRQNPADEACRLDAADLLIDLQRNDEAEQLLALEYTADAGRAQALRARLALAAGGGDIAALEAAVAENPGDHQRRLELSRAYAAAGRYREALEAALTVVRQDRLFADGAARQAMLQLFEALGGSEQHDDLVREFRRALSAALN